MRRIPFRPLGGLLLCLACSCNTRPSCLPEFPDAADVASVRIVPGESVPPGQWPEKPLTRADEIRAVLRWLREIDWSAKPGDIRVMDPPPLSRLTLTQKNGSTVAFGLVDGGIVVDECNGLWPADTDRLKAIWP